MLGLVRDPDHISPEWSVGYWPSEGEEADQGKWEAIIEAFRDDMRDLEGTVQDPATNVCADLPLAPGYTIRREILLVANHNAYHMGEFAILRQMMGNWKPGL